MAEQQWSELDLRVIKVDDTQFDVVATVSSDDEQVAEGETVQVVKTYTGQPEAQAFVDGVAWGIDGTVRLFEKGS